MTRSKSEKKAAKAAERLRAAEAAERTAEKKARRKSKQKADTEEEVDEMELDEEPQGSPPDNPKNPDMQKPAPASGEDVGNFNGLLEQDEEEEDIEFFFGDAAVSYAGKRERELDPWVLEIKPKKPIAFYDNHMEPWGTMTQERIRSTLTSNPFFIFGATAGRFNNERKVALVAASTKQLLQRDVQVIQLAKANPWSVVVLNSKEEIELLEKQGAVMNRQHNTLIVYRKLRKSPFSTRSITVLRVNMGKESLVKQALLEKYEGCIVEARRRGAEPGQIMGDVVCIVKLQKGASFEYPRQLKTEKDISLEAKHTPPCLICHSNDHYEFDCPWGKVDKDFNRYRIDYGEPKKSDSKVDNVQNPKDQ